MQHSADPTSQLFESHPRSFASNRYVYPVLSRRAGGISIGINLNRDKSCNFNCAYCQVVRTVPGWLKRVDLKQIAAELEWTIELVTSGQIYENAQFRNTPPARAPAKRHCP